MRRVDEGELVLRLLGPRKIRAGLGATWVAMNEADGDGAASALCALVASRHGGTWEETSRREIVGGFLVELKQIEAPTRAQEIEQRLRDVQRDAKRKAKVPRGLVSELVRELTGEGLDAEAPIKRWSDVFGPDGAVTRAKRARN